MRFYYISPSSQLLHYAKALHNWGTAVYYPQKQSHVQKWEKIDLAQTNAVDFTNAPLNYWNTQILLNPVRSYIVPPLQTYSDLGLLGHWINWRLRGQTIYPFVPIINSRVLRKLPPIVGGLPVTLVYNTDVLTEPWETDFPVLLTGRNFGTMIRSFHKLRETMNIVSMLPYWIDKASRNRSIVSGVSVFKLSTSVQNIVSSNIMTFMVCLIMGMEYHVEYYDKDVNLYHKRKKISFTNFSSELIRSMLYEN